MVFTWGIEFVLDPVPHLSHYFYEVHIITHFSGIRRLRLAEVKNLSKLNSQQMGRWEWVHLHLTPMLPALNYDITEENIFLIFTCSSSEKSTAPDNRDSEYSESCTQDKMKDKMRKEGSPSTVFTICIITTIMFIFLKLLHRYI